MLAAENRHVLGPHPQAAPQASLRGRQLAAELTRSRDGLRWRTHKSRPLRSTPSTMLRMVPLPRFRGGGWLALPLAPNLVRDLDEAGELDPLIRLGKVVAVGGRRKTALVAQAALLKGYVFGRLLDPPLDLVLGLGLGFLRTHEAEHDRSALRREPERREVARTLVVVFEEEAVDLHLVEQNLGDRLVAALRHPGAPEVAAAQMHTDRHVGRPLANRFVDEPAIEAGQRVRVVAARLRASADVGIA